MSRCVALELCSSVEENDDILLGACSPSRVSQVGDSSALYTIARANGNVNMVMDTYGRTALHLAAGDADLASVVGLLEEVRTMDFRVSE